jgi:hypothetical protein
MSEYNVVDNAITLPPSGIYFKHAGPQRLEEIVYQDDDWRAVAGDTMVSLGIMRQTRSEIGPVFTIRNTDIDLTPDGSSAAYIQEVRQTSGDVARIGVAAPFSVDATPRVIRGPTIYFESHGPSIAISSDGQYVAAGLGGKVECLRDAGS